MDTAVFAGGCFWCTEAIFQRLTGVTKVTPGYANSTVPHPTYDQVSSGTTGAAESIRVEFDPAVISYDTLLEVFFATHDPTTQNQQGADVGTQYRSAVFYSDDSQKQAAEIAKSKIANAVTEITPLTDFTPAEDYHHNYYDTNRQAPYCRLVIDPKIKKLLTKYPDKVKDGSD